MRSLLPYYERELAFLRQSAGGFAERYPKIAGRLQLSADVSPDPHVERMIESFALLAGRIHKRLDDDFPLFTESLLRVLYPHYLQSFPACSIAQFDLGPAAGQLSQVVRLARGTELSSRLIRGVACRFRTTQDVDLLPVRISAASFRHALGAPDGTALPVGVTAALTLTVELTSPQCEWHLLNQKPVRVFLDGEPSQVCALREALTSNVCGVMWQPDNGAAWQQCDINSDGVQRLPSVVGFEDDEALLDVDARSNSAYRLLTEYFAFPEKFNFVDLPLHLPGDRMPAAGQAERNDPSRRALTLHLLLRGVRSDSHESKMLEAVSARNFLLGCSPVINLFQQAADPIRVNHATVSYPVLVDARRAHAYEVYSLDRVFRVKQTPQGETVDEFRPFFSIQHEGLQSEGFESGTDGREPQSPGRFWSLNRDEDLAIASPGYETQVTIVDPDFRPAAPQTETLSLTVTATNRDLPSQLAIGCAGGDLFQQGGSAFREIRLLRKPTPSRRFDIGPGTLWRLISHLTLNHLSISGNGIDALREMMRLYDLPGSASNRRQIDGMVAVSYRPATAWLPGEPFATFVRGTEVRLEVDESSFVGSGLRLFASMLDRFFALSVHVNSFTQLTIVSARTQEEVVSCPPRSGDMVLV